MTRIFLALTFLASVARADPTTLRMATVAPEGTGWARVLRSFGREVEQTTSGRVRIKWYLNAVAGDEAEMASRVGRGQLDGMGSGGMFCQAIAPSMRVLRVPGLFQSREEASHVVYSLEATLENEARERGWVFLGGAPVGVEVLMTKREVHTMAEIKALRLWRWKADQSAVELSRAMGLQIVAADVSETGKLLDDGKADGAWAVATAAIAWEWTLRAPIVTNLPSSYLFGCVVLSEHALANVSADDRKLILSAAAHLQAAIEDVTKRAEKALYSGALQHQGVRVIEPSDALRAEFFALANAARDKKGPELLTDPLLKRTRQLLSDYRAEHRRSYR
jgi:TRAP-type C4-dicarboxylate transport system substrate-binding protein